MMAGTLHCGNFSDMHASTHVNLVTKWMRPEDLLTKVLSGDIVEIDKGNNQKTCCIYVGLKDVVQMILHSPYPNPAKPEAKSGWFNFASFNYLPSFSASSASGVAKGEFCGAGKIQRVMLADVCATGSDEVCKCRINNSIDRLYAPLPAEEIVSAALDNRASTEYHLLHRNCQHFVNWCRCRVKISPQVIQKLQKKLEILDRLPATRNEKQSVREEEDGLLSQIDKSTLTKAAMIAILEMDYKKEENWTK